MKELIFEIPVGYQTQILKLYTNITEANIISTFGSVEDLILFETADDIKNKIIKVGFFVDSVEISTYPYATCREV